MVPGFGFGSRRRVNKKMLLRWIFYSLILLLFYTIMYGGFFRGWQPILIIPLAIAVAMHERETGSAVFGVFCGLLIDTASGNLLGMSSVWLMPCALAVSLLVMNLMRANFINHIWMSAVTCLLMVFMKYFFVYVIWDTPDSGIILRNYLLPSYLSAILLSPGVYYLVKRISLRFKEKESGQLSGIEEEPEIENNFKRM
jgi:rod shape-determining protein MreD